MDAGRHKIRLEGFRNERRVRSCGGSWWPCGSSIPESGRPGAARLPMSSPYRSRGDCRSAQPHALTCSVVLVQCGGGPRGPRPARPDAASTRSSNAGSARRSPPAACGRARSCPPCGSSPSSCASTPTRSRASTRELERSGVLETRRGVGSFVSASPARAHPPRERDRRLRAFVTRVLADADSAGFTLDELARRASPVNAQEER